MSRRGYRRSNLGKTWRGRSARPGRAAASPRLRTTQTRVVLFGTYAARTSMGALLRIAERVRLGLDPSRAIPVARITTRVASRWVLNEG